MSKDLLARAKAPKEAVNKPQLTVQRMDLMTTSAGELYKALENMNNEIANDFKRTLKDKPPALVIHVDRAAVICALENKELKTRIVLVEKDDCIEAHEEKYAADPEERATPANTPNPTTPVPELPLSEE